MRLRSGVVLGACLLAGMADAMTFSQAFDAALANDAVFRAAGFELAAAREVLPAARAALLPSVTYQASRSDITGSRSFPNSLNQEVTVPLNYSSPSSVLSLRQPILNLEGIGRYRQAEAQVEVAEATYATRNLDLVDRLAAAYLQVLLNEDTLELGSAQVATVRAQVARSDQRFRRGEGTRIETATAQAALDVAALRELEALDQVEAARRALSRITGVSIDQLRQMAGDATVPPLLPADAEAWVDIGLRQSAVLRARQKTVEVARANVSRIRAQHLPRLDLVAAASDSRSDSLSTINQSSSQRSIGLQFTLPIFSGGATQAAVRQAQADLSRTEEELRNERQVVESELRRLYKATLTAAIKIDAFKSALASNAVALQGTSRALETGLATTADALDAQTRYYSAGRDLAQARYEYLLNRLRLLSVAGYAVADIVADIDRHLTVDNQALRRRTP